MRGMRQTIRLCVAVFALLAYVNQSFAYVIVHCSGMGDQPMSMMSMKMADAEQDNVPAKVLDMAHEESSGHHGHHVQPSESAETDASDCCSHPQCGQTDCVTVNAVLVGSLTPFAVQRLQTPDPEYAGTWLTAEISSLFRPPISR